MPRNTYRGGGRGLVLLLLACYAHAAPPTDNATPMPGHTRAPRAAGPSISRQLTDWLDGEIAALAHTVDTLPGMRPLSHIRPGRAVPDDAHERSAGSCPCHALAAVRDRLTEAGELMRRIDRWDAERPEPPGGVEALVAAAHGYAVEQTNLREMERTLRNLIDAMTRWSVLQTRQVAEDREALVELRRQHEVRQDCTACLAELADWGNALEERLKRCGDETENALARQWSPKVQRVHAEAGDTVTPEDEFVTAHVQAEKLLRSFSEALPVDKAESHRAGGAAIRLTRNAQAYPDAAAVRRRLQSQLADLVRLIDGCRIAVVARLADTRRRLSALLDSRPATRPPNQEEAEKDRTADNIESFEYFEVHNPSTLREISALPGLYGDPEQWQRLKKANPGAATAPDENVPKGTVLVIPRGQVSE